MKKEIDRQNHGQMDKQTNRKYERSSVTKFGELHRKKITV